MQLQALHSLKQQLSKAAIWTEALEFNRWEYIKTAGTANTNLYFIEEGCARVYFSEDSDEHCLYFGHSGSLISALDSFLSEKPSSIVIQCINKTKVKVIHKKTFHHFIQNNNEASNLWQQVLTDLMQWHLEREKDLLINSPALRYERVLSRQPDLFQQIPHKYIASYLRMTPETLSRILNS
ncbi:Crp/Fnr family transcriptional regulator [Flavobacteriaceae bacterium S356]|uniref:Crp/Fnr family transcriptional regulator n=1 Tax=Asprobacillus argus TaxID=3076534 RepID=A0ABU3LFM2_9FLAO|nr:Crp/Fnr family transcriptional regulator [Flavobacteriaceae bacterium S356]